MANNKNSKGNKGNNENVKFTFADPSRDSSLVIAELLEEQKREERKKADAEAKAAAEAEAAADAEAEEIAEADTPDGAEVTDKETADEEDKTEKKSAGKKKTAFGKAKAAAEAQADGITESKAEETVSEEPKKTEEKSAEKEEKKAAGRKKKKETEVNKAKKAAEKEEKKAADNKKKKEAAAKKAADKEEKAAKKAADKEEKAAKKTAEKAEKAEKKAARKKTASGKAKATETKAKTDEITEAKAEETVSEEPKKTEEKAAEKAEKTEKKAARKKKTASGKAKAAAEAQADEITKEKVEKTVFEEPEKTEEKAAEKAEKKTVRKKKTASGKAKAAAEAQGDEITEAKAEETVSEEPKKTEEKAAEKEEKKTAGRKNAAAETSAAENAAPDTEEKRSGRVKRHLEQAEKLLKEKKESKERTVVVLAAAAVILVLFIAAVWGVYRSMYKTCYVASTSKEAVLYAENEEADGELTEAGRVIRGSEIRVYRDTVETEQGVFRRAEAEQTTEKDGGADAEADSAEAAEDKAEAAEDKAEAKTLYINEENIAETADDVVRETEVYVRTPVTIYAEAEGPAIASFAPKGSCLEVRGYDSLEKDGSIHKYKIAYTDPEGEAGEGYVYGKYMTDSQESADAVYNENGIYDKAKEDVYYFNLHGGKAKNLDYYPYEKPVIEGNEFCADARTMYLNCAAVVHPKNYVKIINDTDCNAVVCDIKDGVLAYESEVAKEISPRSYKTAYVSEEEYKAGVDALRETGAYLIGRIVVFNDPIYAKDHPENCIKEGGSTNWPSAYSRGVWEYNVRLAQEAVEKFGFNEIQFDYVRFPESSYEMSKEGGVKWRNRYDEEKGQAVQNFCFYAADQIHEAGAYFSIDVFGESAYGYMTAYGQYWPGLTNIVDAISAMPYTDHTGGEGAWEDPYGTVKRWAKRAKKMQDYVENPAAARTWITGYDTPYWAPTVDYGPKKLKQQVNALKKAGLTGGFIPWNSGSSLAKYRQYKDVWNTD